MPSILDLGFGANYLLKERSWWFLCSYVFWRQGSIGNWVGCCFWWGNWNWVGL